jgi:hypothetical protein
MTDVTPEPKPEPSTPIVVSSPYAATPLPQPAAVMREPSRNHAILRGAIGALFAIGAIVNLAATGGFPSNAPVEMLVSFLLTIDMIIVAVLLAIFAVLAGTRRSVPVAPGRTSPMSVAALILAAVATVAWLLFGIVPSIGALASGSLLHYTDEVGVLAIFGIPWVLATVFGALSLRSGGPRTVLFGSLALGAGVVLLIAALTASVLYSMGLTT